MSEIKEKYFAQRISNCSNNRQSLLYFILQLKKNSAFLSELYRSVYNIVLYANYTKRLSVGLHCDSASQKLNGSILFIDFSLTLLSLRNTELFFTFFQFDLRAQFTEIKFILITARLNESLCSLRLLYRKLNLLIVNIFLIYEIIFL